jgi:hypothetical protein
VRIFFGLALGVMLAMDRDPFLGHHASGKPRPETEKMRQQRMEIHATVRLAAMQIQGHGKNRQTWDLPRKGKGTIRDVTCPRQ